MNEINEILWSNAIAILGLSICILGALGIYFTKRWPWEKSPKSNIELILESFHKGVMSRDDLCFFNSKRNRV